MWLRAKVRLSGRFLLHRHPADLEPLGDGHDALAAVAGRVNRVYLLGGQRCSIPSLWFRHRPAEP